MKSNRNFILLFVLCATFVAISTSCTGLQTTGDIAYNASVKTNHGEFACIAKVKFDTEGKEIEGSLSCSFKVATDGGLRYSCENIGLEYIGKDSGKVLNVESVCDLLTPTDE